MSENVLTIKLIAVALFAWIFTQIIKIIIDKLHHRNMDKENVFNTVLWRTGGMPSSHAALVTCLTFSLGFHYGFSSPFFIISFFYGSIVIRDSVGVRRSAGMQAQLLNKLGKELSAQMNTEFITVKEVMGHTPAEATVGVFLGLGIAVAADLLGMLLR